MFASEGRRVMSRCRLAAEDDDLFEFVFRAVSACDGISAFDFRRRPRRARAVRLRARRAVRRPKRRSATRSFYKKKYSISCAVGVRPHAHHTLTSAQGRAARSV